MLHDRLRQQIAWEAAARIFLHEETEYYKAKINAARRLGHGTFDPAALPSNRDISRLVQDFLRRGLPAEPPPGCAPLDLSGVVGRAAPVVDRFLAYRMLLAPLAETQQNPEKHPEGDALYHSLQVFDLARNELPYDEEFLLAALLHDVGKAIDRRDHVAAGLEALAGFITERTAWLIEHHSLAAKHREGTLGHRVRQRLEASEHFEDLQRLSQCDRLGRVVGADAPELDEALAYIRQLADDCESDDSWPGRES